MKFSYAIPHLLEIASSPLKWLLAMTSCNFSFFSVFGLLRRRKVAPPNDAHDRKIKIMKTAISGSKKSVIL